MRHEPSLVGSVIGPPFDCGVERAVLGDPGATRVPILFGSVAQTESSAITVDVDGLDEERNVVDGEVRPIVAVREDVAPVVGMTANPRTQRRSKSSVLHLFSVVPESSPRIETDGAFARAPLGWGKPEEIGMVAGL